MSRSVGAWMRYADCVVRVAGAVVPALLFGLRYAADGICVQLLLTYLCKTSGIVIPACRFSFVKSRSRDSGQPWHRYLKSCASALIHQ